MSALHDDRRHVMVHRSCATRTTPDGEVLDAARYDWFHAEPDEDRWVAFHRSEHLDAVTAWCAARAAAADRRWTTLALGRPRADVAAAPAVVADLQRSAVAALRRAHGDAALRAGRVDPAELRAHEATLRPEDLPCEVLLPADPEADRLPLSAIFAPDLRATLARHGVTTLGALSRCSRPVIAGWTGIGTAELGRIERTLHRHGLLLAPERPAAPAERRAARLRVAARAAELAARGYRLDEIARDLGRSPAALRLLLAERRGARLR
ncbi:hypothetical protein SK069_20085 [Patulibacter brassicae]|uniref:RNA polymerase alpha subunit C-terminal domain-containing protein n=1 Tax=Patulibacter brassicae TaxID=1705717 RepID=A0ABU4VPX0_9ACTN|nr:hypothetical protein [Patulibacter brassicae]MDX8153909.1 hypothetical protein [Patulibacter brassicae]